MIAIKLAHGAWRRLLEAGEEKMKAIEIKAPGIVRCRDISEPVPKEGETLIRVNAVGICGSDIGAYRGSNSLVSYPRIIGHEIAGEVISVSGQNPKGLKTGDRVVADPYIYCGKCYPCSIGRTNCCNELQVLGVHRDGGMQEYLCHPSDMLVKIPEHMDWNMAAMAEPLTISLHGIHRGGLKFGEYCAIIGAGPIGLVAGLVAQSYGAHAILIDLIQERLNLARSLGIEFTVNSGIENPVEKIREFTGGELAQLVMECSGSNSAVRSTLDMVCHAGRITFTGWPEKETALPTDLITKKEIDIRGARTSAGEFEEALALINSQRVDMAGILTKTVKIEEAPEIIESISKNPEDYMKVVVTMG